MRYWLYRRLAQLRLERQLRTNLRIASLGKTPPNPVMVAAMKRAIATSRRP